MGDAFLCAVVRAHGRPLLRFFASRVAEASEAQDLVQEVYVRLLRVRRPELIRCVKAYVYAVAARVAFEYRQKRVLRHLHVALEDEAAAGTFAVTHEPLVTLERVDEVAVLLGGLPAKLQSVLIWAHRDGYTYEEIGARLSVPRHRVKKYLARALAECREKAAVVGTVA